MTKPFHRLGVNLRKVCPPVMPVHHSSVDALIVVSTKRLQCETLLILSGRIMKPTLGRGEDLQCYNNYVTLFDHISMFAFGTQN